jgi:hypothetical protein
LSHASAACFAARKASLSHALHSLCRGFIAPRRRSARTAAVFDAPPSGVAAGDRQQTCPTAWHRPGAAGGGRLASFSRPQDGDDPRPHRHRRPCARQLQPNAFARRHQRSDPHAALSCAGGSSLKPMWRRMIARLAHSRPSAPRPRPAPWLRLAHPRPRRLAAQRRRRPAIGCRLGMRPHRDPARWPRPRRRGRCSSPSPR